MTPLKSWLARKAARLVASDPEAVRIIAAAMPKPAAASDGIVWSGSGEIVISAKADVTPEAIKQALTDYDKRFNRVWRPF